MNDGYYYFHSVDNKSDADRSLGYVSLTFPKDKNVLYYQCSLNKDDIFTLAKNRFPIELYISPVTYVTNSSVFAGKFPVHSKARLFIDSAINFRCADFANENLYAIVTAGGRTILYSEIHRAATTPDTSVISPPHPDDSFGSFFDPFNTTNSAYKWYIHFAKSSGEPGEIFRRLNIHPEMFAKININGIKLMPDTFTKMTHYALRVAGHIIRGEYTDPSSGREFTVIGIPGWNVVTKRKSAPSIRLFARWIAAVNKPSDVVASSYNGYWLYYFDKESGFPVKAVLKKN